MRNINIGKRVILEPPEPGWHAGHGGDEYGNCSLYLRTPLGGIVVFVDLDYQDQVELPDPGTHPWIDVKYYGAEGSEPETPSH